MRALAAAINDLPAKVNELFWPFRSPRASTDAKRDIGELQRKLRDGRSRFQANPVSLSFAWFPEYMCPDDGDQFESDYRVSGRHKELKREFAEEIYALRDAIEDTPEEVFLADWQKSTTPAGRRMYASLNMRAFALSNWDRYGVPLRLRDGFVYRLWVPTDVLNVLGDPVIKRVPADDFIREVACKTAIYRFRILQLEAQGTVYRTIAIIAAGILFLLWF